MKNRLIKTKKGGLDTIVAYIVVSLPLLYVLIYMVATIYHFSVQMYFGQVAKEVAVMAGTYGDITLQQENYVHTKLKGILPSPKDSSKADITIQYYRKPFKEGAVAPENLEGPFTLDNKPEIGKADIIGVFIESNEPSMLANVSAFRIFGKSDEAKLKYSAYREEIIRNEKQYDE